MRHITSPSQGSYIRMCEQNTKYTWLFGNINKPHPPTNMEWRTWLTQEATPTKKTWWPSHLLWKKFG